MGVVYEKNVVLENENMRNKNGKMGTLYCGMRMWEWDPPCPGRTAVMNSCFFSSVSPEPLSSCGLNGPPEPLSSS